LYRQLLGVQIPKAQKDSQAVSLFVLSGSASAKAAHRKLMKLTPDCKKYVCLFEKYLLWQISMKCFGCKSHFPVF